jgi:hypothetical protein
MVAGVRWIDEFSQLAAQGIELSVVEHFDAGEIAVFTIEIQLMGG